MIGWASGEVVQRGKCCRVLLGGFGVAMPVQYFLSRDCCRHMPKDVPVVVSFIWFTSSCAWFVAGVGGTLIKLYINDTYVPKVFMA